MNLGKVLFAFRAVNGMEAQALADAIGISAASLSRIETGKRDGVSGAALVKIMAWLVGLK